MNSGQALETIRAKSTTTTTTTNRRCSHQHCNYASAAAIRSRRRPLSEPFALRLLDCNGGAAKVYEILVSKLRWFTDSSSNSRRLYFVEIPCHKSMSCTNEANSSVSDNNCYDAETASDDDNADDIAKDCDSLLEAILMSQQHDEAIMSGSSCNNSMTTAKEKPSNRMQHQNCVNFCDCMKRTQFSSAIRSSSTYCHGSGLKPSSRCSCLNGFSNSSELESETERHDEEHGSDLMTDASEIDVDGTGVAGTERRLRLLEIKVDKLVAHISQICSSKQ